MMIKTQVKQALVSLREGKFVLAASEAGYGLLVSLHPMALSRIHTWRTGIAGEPPRLIVCISRAEHLQKLLPRHPSRQTLRLMETLWPGPVQLDLEARDTLSPLLRADGRVRVTLSSAPPLQELTSDLNAPLAFQPLTTGSDRSPLTLDAAAAHLPSRPWSALVHWDPPRIQRPTVLDCVTSPPTLRTPRSEAPTALLSTLDDLLAHLEP